MNCSISMANEYFEDVVSDVPKVHLYEALTIYAGSSQ